MIYENMKSPTWKSQGYNEGGEVSEEKKAHNANVAKILQSSHGWSEERAQDWLDNANGVPKQAATTTTTSAPAAATQKVEPTGSTYGTAVGGGSVAGTTGTGYTSEQQENAIASNLKAQENVASNPNYFEDKYGMTVDEYYQQEEIAQQQQERAEKYNQHGSDQIGYTVNDDGKLQFATPEQTSAIYQAVGQDGFTEVARFENGFYSWDDLSPEVQEFYTKVDEVGLENVNAPVETAPVAPAPAPAPPSIQAPPPTPATNADRPIVSVTPTVTDAGITHHDPDVHESWGVEDAGYNPTATPSFDYTNKVHEAKPLLNQSYNQTSGQNIGAWWNDPYLYQLYKSGNADFMKIFSQLGQNATAQDYQSALNQAYGWNFGGQPAADQMANSGGRIGYNMGGPVGYNAGGDVTAYAEWLKANSPWSSYDVDAIIGLIQNPESGINLDGWLQKYQNATGSSLDVVDGAVPITDGSAGGDGTTGQPEQPTFGFEATNIDPASFQGEGIYAPLGTALSDINQYLQDPAYGSPDYFPGQTLADFNETQKAGQEALVSGSNQQGALATQLSNVVDTGLQGKYGYDPALQKYADYDPSQVLERNYESQYLTPAIQNAQQSAIANVNTGFGQAGTLGGARNARAAAAGAQQASLPALQQATLTDFQTANQRDLSNQAALNQAAQFGSTAYNQNQAANAGAYNTANQFNLGQISNFANLVPTAQTAQLSQGNTLQTVGQQLQDQDQAAVNEQVKAWNFNQAQQLQDLYQRLGLAQVGQAAQAGNITQDVQGSGGGFDIGSVLGLGLPGGGSSGVGGLLGSLFSNSGGMVPRRPVRSFMRKKGDK